MGIFFNNVLGCLNATTILMIHILASWHCFDIEKVCSQSIKIILIIQLNPCANNFVVQTGSMFPPPGENSRGRTLPPSVINGPILTIHWIKMGTYIKLYEFCVFWCVYVIKTLNFFIHELTIYNSISWFKTVKWPKVQLYSFLQIHWCGTLCGCVCACVFGGWLNKTVLKIRSCNVLHIQDTGSNRTLHTTWTISLTIFFFRKSTFCGSKLKHTYIFYIDT